MSVAVELEELRERVEEYGPTAFLTTVGRDGRAHVVSVAVRLEGQTLVAGVGSTTASNIDGQPAVTLLWAAPSGTDYCLILDGTAVVRDGVDEKTAVVTPSRAVLHRLADAAGDGPNCVTVLDRR